MSCRLEILVNFGQVFALFFGAFIVDFEYSMSLNATLWHIFGEHQVDVMFVGVIFNFYCFIAFPIGKTCSMSLMRFNNRTFTYFFISLLNLRGITKPCPHLHPAPSTSTQLHPPPPSSFQPPPSSLQHPQQYLNQNIHVIGQFPQI